VIKEWTLVNPVKVYREYLQGKAARDQRLGCSEFIFIRLVSTRLGRTWHLEGRRLARRRDIFHRGLHNAETTESTDTE